MIRPATRDDIPRLVEMAQRFYPESPYPLIYGDMPKEQVAGLSIIAMEGLASHGIVPGVMLVAEHEGELVGMACLHVDPSTFNPVTVAGEIVWWIEPEHRGGMTAVRLLKASEKAAQERGAHVVRMACLATSPPEAAAIYERMGYAHTETIFTKRLH